MHWLAAVAADYGVIAVHPDAPTRRSQTCSRSGAGIRTASSSSAAAPWAAGSHEGAALARAAGIDPLRIRYVPFDGGGEAIELVAGRIEVFSGDATEARRRSRRASARWPCSAGTASRCAPHPDGDRTRERCRLGHLARLLHARRASPTRPTRCGSSGCGRWQPRPSGRRFACEGSVAWRRSRRGPGVRQALVRDMVELLTSRRPLSTLDPSSGRGPSHRVAGGTSAPWRWRSRGSRAASWSGSSPTRSARARCVSWLAAGALGLWHRRSSNRRPARLAPRGSWPSLSDAGGLPCLCAAHRAAGVPAATTLLATRSACSSAAGGRGALVVGFVVALSLFGLFGVSACPFGGTLARRAVTWRSSSSGRRLRGRAPAGQPVGRFSAWSSGRWSACCPASARSTRSRS